MDILKVLLFSFQRLTWKLLASKFTLYCDFFLSFFSSYIGELAVLTSYYLMSKIIWEEKVPQM